MRVVRSSPRLRRWLTPLLKPWARSGQKRRPGPGSKPGLKPGATPWAGPGMPHDATSQPPDATALTQEATAPETQAAPKRRRGKHRWSTLWPKIVLGMGLVLVLLAGAGLVVTKSLLDRYESSVTRDVLLAPSARGMSPEAQATAWRDGGGPLNFLLIGSDMRSGYPDEGQRSDTIIIVQINRERTGAHLVSIPRDLLVDIPEFPQADFYGSRQKINAAFHYGGGNAGGVQLLSATLAELIGVRFDGAAVIDFGGFERIIDLLGGVRLCVDTEVTSIHTSRHFQLGCQTFSGAEALDYSRQRYGLESGDYDRQRHNQQLLKAIFNTALSNGIAHNPVKIDQFIRALGSSLTLDTGGVTLADVLIALRGLRPDALVGVAVPSYPEMIGDESYILLNEDAPLLFDAIHQAKLADWAMVNPQWVHSL